VFTAGVYLVQTPPREGAQRSAILESVLPEDRLEDSKRTATKQRLVWACYENGTGNPGWGTIGMGQERRRAVQGDDGPGWERTATGELP
jgi:hypothetical protein